MLSATHLLRKGLEGPKLSPLADLKALCMLEVKAKAELEMAYWKVESVPQHTHTHTQDLWAKAERLIGLRHLSTSLSNY